MLKRLRSFFIFLLRGQSGTSNWFKLVSFIATEIIEQNQMPWDLARAYALYAEFFQNKGDLVQAKEKLGKAIELMRGCNADGWVKKYEEELAGL
jgi:hypothetical protein